MTGRCDINNNFRKRKWYILNTFKEICLPNLEFYNHKLYMHCTRCPESICSFPKKNTCILCIPNVRVNHHASFDDVNQYLWIYRNESVQLY